VTSPIRELTPRRVILGRPTSATITEGSCRDLLDWLPRRELESFGMGPAVMLGQDLSEGARPVSDGAVEDSGSG
jgi:hypothetical protein